jgi:hypothetical protein
MVGAYEQVRARILRGVEHGQPRVAFDAGQSWRIAVGVSGARWQEADQQRAEGDDARLGHCRAAAHADS